MKKWTLSLVLLLGAWLLPAQNTAMLFLPVNRDAATVGGAQALSSLYNPAAIPFTGSDVQLSYQRWAPSVASANHLNLLSGIRIGKRVGVGLTVGYQMGEEFALTDGTFFMPSDLLVGLGAGVAFTDYLSLGVKAKYARQGLTKEVAYQAFAADAFLLFSMAGFRATAGVASVGTPVQAAGGAQYALPSSAVVGLGYGFAFVCRGLCFCRGRAVCLEGHALCPCGVPLRLRHGARAFVPGPGAGGEVYRHSPGRELLNRLQGPREQLHHRPGLCLLMLPGVLMLPGLWVAALPGPR